MAKNILNLSTMPKTWIFDIDGTMVKHNGHMSKNGDSLLAGVKTFFDNNVRDEDYILILTARDQKYKMETVDFLKKSKIRFNKIIFSLPAGERIIINDTKPAGMITAHAVPVERDEGLSSTCVVFDKEV